MAVLRDIVIDCRHPASLARFWADVLEGYAVAPYDDTEIERLRGIGIDDVENDPTVLVEAPGTTPRFFFQRVPEGKIVKNRVHVDLLTTDLATEVARLQQLGARLVEAHDAWRVLRDPEGNEFCLSV